VAVCQRAILIKKILQLWGRGSSIIECAEATKLLSEEFKAPYLVESSSWSVMVEGFGYSIPMKNQESVRKNFSHIAFEGPVRCRNPDNMFWVLLEYEARDQTEPFETRTELQAFFGREVGAAAAAARRLVGRNDLKKRAYLGPTAMDNELSLVMANMARARPGSWVFDPFAGTGSILVACAQFGAFCTGTDIDIRVLRGKGGRNPHSNFDQYGLPRPELVRADNHLWHRHWRPRRPLYDAVVCDPPYGIRAGARKSGSKKDRVNPVPEDKRRDHIPQTQVYPVEDVMQDLMIVSAKTLRIGGRLCYLLPCTYDLTEEQLPTHPCLRLVANSLERMTLKLGRRLITMEKIKEYEYEKEHEYRDSMHFISETPDDEEREGKKQDLPYSNLREKTKRTNVEATPPPPLKKKPPVPSSFSAAADDDAAKV